MKNSYLSLKHTLSTDTFDENVLTLFDEREKTYRTFRREVAALAAELEGDMRYLLSCNSTYLFTVGLFAIWSAGSTAVMLPNNSEKTIEEYRDYGGAIITDHDVSAKMVTLDPACCGETDPTNEILSDTRISLELFTSGSTGDKKCIVKTISNLDAELQVLYELFGEGLTKAVTYATVSHQHIYGLLYKVLLTLVSGRSFVDRSFLFPDELVEEMSREESPAILVSGPAHLKRFPKLLEKQDLSLLCSLLFSSGGLLDEPSALAFRCSFSLAPIEVLGSTETGGVAYRQQGESAESKLWTPFPVLSVSSDGDGFLQVDSPFITPSEAVSNPFVMGDLIRNESEGRFTLLGRGDRIVKIEENRVSLEEIEKLLMQHDTIAEARVIPVQKKKDGFDKKVLAAFVVFEEGSAGTDKQTLRDYLEGYLRSVVVPKLWRFLPQLPYNEQGKITVQALEAHL